jgi:hypothetical protein
VLRTCTVCRSLLAIVTTKVTVFYSAQTEHTRTLMNSNHELSKQTHITNTHVRIFSIPNREYQDQNVKEFLFSSRLPPSPICFDGVKIKILIP